MLLDQLTKKRVSQRKGSIIFIIVIFMMLLSMSILSVTIIIRAQIKDVTRDVSRDETYYVANAGLEIVYAMLFEDRTGGSLLSRVGKDPNYSINDIDGLNPVMKQDNLKLKYNGTQFGIVNLRVYTQQFEGNWYYKIVSEGSLLEESQRKGPTDTRIMTMYVPILDPTSPLIFDGQINKL